MKYIIKILFLLGVFQLSAQELTYGISEIDYEDEIVKTINIKLEPKPSTIEDKIEDWMNDNYDVDLDGKKLLFFDKEFMSAKGVVIPKISTRKIDLLVKVDETQTDITRLDVFGSFGYNNWITPEDYPYEFAKLEGIVYEFIADYLPSFYKQKIAKSKEIIDELVANEKKFKEDIAENKAEIEKAEAENQELMQKLRENQEKLRSARNRLAEKSKAYKTIKNKVDFN